MLKIEIWWMNDLQHKCRIYRNLKYAALLLLYIPTNIRPTYFYGLSKNMICLVTSKSMKCITSQQPQLNFYTVGWCEWICCMLEVCNLVRIKCPHKNYAPHHQCSMDFKISKFNDILMDIFHKYMSMEYFTL